MSTSPGSHIESVRQRSRAVQEIKARTDLIPEVALILGSGLGGLAEEFRLPVEIHYADLDGFPLSTAPGHAGKLVLGMFAGRASVAMVGRAHMYEGYSAQDVTYGVRLLRELGARTLVVTNAAGGVNTAFRPGSLMLIADHINLTGTNPLIGSNDGGLGVRFPDMSHAYSVRLRSLARDVASRQRVAIEEGVYAGLLGPSYETPAEIRMLRTLGADAVGMSTVMEVIAAVHAGMEVLGISCITNMAAGVLDQELREEEVLETAAAVRGDFSSLIRGVVAALAQEAAR